MAALNGIYQMLLVFGVVLADRIIAEVRETVEEYTIECDSAEAGCDGEQLEPLARRLRHQSNVQINITAPQLQLGTSLTFTQLNSLSIVGNTNCSTVINCTDKSSGLIIQNITNLILRNLILTNCGAFTRSKFNRTYSSALTIDRGTNIEISALSIVKSRGVGLTILHHQGGRVVIKSTTFAENKLPQEYQTHTRPSPTQVRGGGGVLIGAFEQKDPNSKMSLEFDGCNFTNNTAYTRYYDYLYIDNSGMQRKGYGRGGGAYLSIKNGLKNVYVRFVNCKFSENEAFLGGGLSVKISGGKNQETTTNVEVEIVDSTFEQNGCGGETSLMPKFSGRERERTPGFGGGAHLSFDTFNKSITTQSRYMLKNVTFAKNCALIGGGVLHFSSRQNTNEKVNALLFENCQFTENQAHTGSAVNIMPNVFLRLSMGHTTVPRFRDCTFIGNRVFSKDTQSQGSQRTAGVGTIYTSLYDVIFEGDNRFENNWGSAIYAVNGIVDLSNSSAQFINNTGINGGAVALTGVSLLRVGPNEYNFTNNRALYKGGAIYALMIDNNDYTTSRSCFIQGRDGVLSLEEWGSNFTFAGNSAKDDTTGHAVFATTLFPCLVVNNGTEAAPEYRVISVSDVFSARGIPLSLDEVATDGAFFFRSDKTKMTIIPGELYSHNIKIRDDLNHTVNTSLRAMILENGSEVELSPEFSSVIGDKIQLSGEPHKQANITLQTVSLRQAYIKVEVELIDCPPGFKLDISLKTCVCNTEAYVALFKCNKRKFHSHLKPGFWVGFVNDRKTPDKTELSTTFCPLCDYSHASFDTSGVILPRNKSELTECVCGSTRMDTLCGTCRPHYTVHYHSPDFLCKPVDKTCKLGWVFFILAELVPVTVVFIAVLALNISFTPGALNGFILFCQLIDSLDVGATGVITRTFRQEVRQTIANPTQVYRVIYGLFNLDFFSSEHLSFCLWNGASALDMLAIKYVTVLYTLLLIAVVVCFINNCGGHCIGKCCRITTIKSSVTHGISTFLIICYGQCVRVSLSLLIFIEIYVENGSQLDPGRRVWYSGNMLYFSKEHLPYALPALFSLLTVGLVPPALLLSYPLLNKILYLFGFDDDSKIYVISRKLPVSSLKPLLDSFQGCFKDNLRFFAGLYFLYRWPVLLIYMTTTSFSTFYMSVGGVLIVILTLHGICQPYIKRAHNIIDTLLMADLVLINGISFFNYYRTRLTIAEPTYDKDSTLTPARIQLVLIYLPLVIVGVYALFIVSKHLRKKGCKGAGKRDWLSSRIPQRAKVLKELAQSITALEHDDEFDDEEELPHRLLAGEINYSYFEDSD